MDLINHTPVPARLEASQVEGMSNRIGMLTAKATFRFDLQGHVHLETQQPVPLFADDQASPLGLLPSDAEPRRDDAFEVMLLGHAYAPGGLPVEQLTVGLSVGAVRKEIVVSGDRLWLPGDGAPAISQPEPFTKVPLTWDRAFGGRQAVQLDASSMLDAAHPINPYGRGFDAERIAAGLGAEMRVPPGYPLLPGYRRRLPNLETPDARIGRWEDEPEPTCWATAPRDVLVGVMRRLQAPVPAESMPPTDFGPPDATGVNTAYYRAHPDWVLRVPREPPIVRLDNLIPEQRVVQFRLPSLRVVGDYVVEGRRGSRALNPIQLVILPDARSFYILYSSPFTFPFHEGDERAFRLRIAEPWYPSSDDGPR